MSLSIHLCFWQAVSKLLIKQSQAPVLTQSHFPAGATSNRFPGSIPVPSLDLPIKLFMTMVRFNPGFQAAVRRSDAIGSESIAGL